MPSLPRIKRTRPLATTGDADATAEPRLAELTAHGLSWVHVDTPTSETHSGCAVTPRTSASFAGQSWIVQ